MAPKGLSTLASAVVLLLVFSFLDRVDCAPKTCYKSKLLVTKADIDAAKTGSPATSIQDACTGLDDNTCFIVISDPAKTDQRKLGFGCGSCSGTGAVVEQFNAFKALDGNVKCEACTTAAADCNKPDTAVDGFTEYKKVTNDKFASTYQACKHYVGEVKSAYSPTTVYCKKETDSCFSGAYWDKDDKGTAKKMAYMGCKMDCDNAVKEKFVSAGKAAACAKCADADCKPAADQLSDSYPDDKGMTTASSNSTQVTTKAAGGGDKTTTGAAAVSPSNAALTAAVGSAMLVLAGAAY